MGVIYTILPASQVTSTSEGTRWLASLGVSLPAPLPPSRFPTVGEIREALKTLNGCEIEYRITEHSWDATISRMHTAEWAALVVMHYDAANHNDNHQYEFFFEAGWKDLITEIVRSLAAKCGPLIILENGENAEVVSGG